MAKLSDLRPDASNANRGTERGRYALEASLRKYGAGRSILIDREGRIIAGNKTAETAADVGIDDVIIVQTDGRQLVAVQRTDLDLDSKEARELAYADNRVAELDLSFDPEQVLADLGAGVDLSGMWFPHELDALTGAVGEEFDPAAEWKGMPEFEHDDQTAEAAFTIRVFLKDADDLAAFGRVLGKDLTGRKFVWFSKQPRGDLYEVYDERPE
jgi:hypothetical protein